MFVNNLSVGAYVDLVRAREASPLPKLLATDGFFKRKDDSLNRMLEENAKDQERVNNKVSRIETQLTRKYSALDTQLSSLNALNNYLAQQISQWNKSNS